MGLINVHPRRGSLNGRGRTSPFWSGRVFVYPVAPLPPPSPCSPSRPCSTHHNEPVMTSSGRRLATMCDPDHAGDGGTTVPQAFSNPLIFGIRAANTWGRQTAELGRGAEPGSCRRRWLIATSRPRIIAQAHTTNRLLGGLVLIACLPIPGRVPGRRARLLWYIAASCVVLL